MRRIVIAALSLVAALALLVGCSQPATETPVEEKPAVETETSAPETEADAESVTGPEEVKGVTVPAFTLMVNGVAIDQDKMAEYPVYEIASTTTNSAGTTKTTTFQGFKISDILDAAGLTEDYTWIEAQATDGYTVEFKGDIVMEDTTLLAITQDGNPFVEGPWFAPGTDDVTSSYAKNISSILVNTEDGAPAGVEHGAASAAAPAAPAEGEPEILDRTDKVEFADYTFKVNGQDVTNADLDGQKIFKITAQPLNKNGEPQPADYTGYKLADVLAAVGVTDFTTVTVIANDGYETELPEDVAKSDHTLLAIEKDKELGEDGTVWVAPTLEQEASKYPKLVVEIQAGA